MRLKLKYIKAVIISMMIVMMLITTISVQAQSNQDLYNDIQNLIMTTHGNSVKINKTVEEGNPRITWTSGKPKAAAQKPVISLNKTTTTIEVNKSEKLKASIKGASSKVSWKSSNKKIASVNSNGKIVGKMVGTATITATANGVSAKCKVKVVSSNSVNGVTKNGLMNKLKKKTSQKIYIFNFENLDLKGTKEAVALTADGRDENGGYGNANLWYISNTKCICFYSERIIYGFEGGGPFLWKVKNTYMFCIETGGYGSGYTTYAWTFTDKGVKEVSVPGMGLLYIKNNQFYITSSDYDAFSDGTGHTYKNYYCYWNGNKFIEYGGIRISQDQLKKAKGASDILNEIKKSGSITDIFYRSNGIININFRSYDSGSKTYWTNYNVTLKLNNGKVIYDTSVNPNGTSMLDKAKYYGVYKKSISNNVEYPKSFTLK